MSLYKCRAVKYIIRVMSENLTISSAVPKPEAERYGPISIALHWLGAVALVLSFTTGDPLEELAGAEWASAYDNHVLWATILGIPLIARVVWRIRRGFKHHRNQHIALWILARCVMIGFLVSIVGAVITGLLLPWTEGQPLKIGALIVASPIPSMPTLYGFMKGGHGLFSHIWIPLLLLHSLGALKHLIIDRDNVFRGIFWPAKAPRHHGSS